MSNRLHRLQRRTKSNGNAVLDGNRHAGEAASTDERRRTGDSTGLEESAPGLSLSEQVGQGTLERMREFPVFVPHEAGAPTRSGATSAGEELNEKNREAMFQSEMMRIFRGRIQFVCLMGIAFLPLFTAFYFVLAPGTTPTIIPINLALMGLLALYAVFVPFAKSLRAVRFSALSGYLLFNVGAGLVIVQVSRDALSQGDAPQAVQFVVLASFVQILLAILVLPFSLWEALFAALVSIGTVMIGLHLSSTQSIAFSLGQMFLVTTTSALVLALSYFNSIMRRQVFDATFDLALSAERMRAMSATDAVTGGANRRQIELLLGAELARASRFHHPVSILMFDLDNFKSVNDTLGHAAGDEVLREVHGFTSSLLREVDTVGRIGGDEFVVILPQTSSRAACYLAQRILNANNERLRMHFGAHTPAGQVTLSVGVLTLQNQPLPDVAETLARVDELLYNAKRDGKNRVIGAEN